MSSPMTHDYIHGYYLEELQLQLEAMKAQFEAEQEERENALNALNISSDAYFTTRDFLENRRNKQIMNTEMEHGIDISKPGSKGVTWDVVEPEGKFSQFREKFLQKAFGVSPKIKALNPPSDDGDNYKGLKDVENEALNQLNNIKTDNDAYPSDAYVDEDAQKYDENLGVKLDLVDSIDKKAIKDIRTDETIYDDNRGVKYKGDIEGNKLLDDSKKKADTKREREKGLVADKSLYGSVAGPSSLLVRDSYRIDESDKKRKREKEWEEYKERHKRGKEDFDNKNQDNQNNKNKDGEEYVFNNDKKKWSLFA